MTHARSVTRRSLALLCAAGVGAGGLTAVAGSPAAAAPPGHDRVVSAVPKAETPNVQDGSVDVILDTGDKIIAGGEFTRVRGIGATQDDERVNIFAFDEDTGAVDQGFKPAVVDGNGKPAGAVTSIVAGPTAGTVYVAGRFANIAGADPKRKGIALLNVADGSVVTTFRAPAFNGAIMDIALVGDRLILAGSFTTATVSGTAHPRGGLASVNALTGALDDYLTVSLTQNHSYIDGSTNARAPIGADKIAVSPDGSQLVAIGNFKKANGAAHDQAVKIDLGAGGATIADWHTTAYDPLCNPDQFDSYVRDVAYAPDGEYFVIVTTGGKVANSLCDTASRWEADATGTGLRPTWSAFSGGDTLLSVGISEQAIYVGGHIRWMNNPLGGNTAGAGAVGRASIAALQPDNGMPLSWNPGRNPRGYGITEMYVTEQGLWIGHDQEWIGAQEYKHDRIAFFPLEGGKPVLSTATHSLPGNVYTFGANPPSPVLYRVNAGGPPIASADGGPNWGEDSATAPTRYHNTGLRHTPRNTWIGSVRIPPVSVGVPREIYSSELLASATAPNIYWDIPIAAGTQITVRLFFSTRCGCSPGTRAFNINIDGVRRLTNFDPTADAGGDNIGTMKSYNITSDGRVDIDLLKVKGSPLINAVEIARNPAPPAVGTENKMFKRSYDGTTAGTRTEITSAEVFPYSGARGGFMVGNMIYFLHGSMLYRRPFDGTTLGSWVAVNPHSDPKWDKVLTYSPPTGQTYAGARPDLYYEIPTITGQFYSAGRLYYTIAGHAALYWRAFSPDSGAVGPARTAVTSPNSMADSGGVFISGGKLYMVSRTTGNLIRMDWTNGAPAGTPTAVSGPTLDSQDWRAKVTFVGP